MHKSSKNSLNEVFYYKDEELYGKILENWKIIFKPNGYEKFHLKINLLFKR